MLKLSIFERENHETFHTYILFIILILDDDLQTDGQSINYIMANGTTGNLILILLYKNYISNYRVASLLVRMKTSIKNQRDKQILYLSLFRISKESSCKVCNQ